MVNVELIRSAQAPEVNRSSIGSSPARPAEVEGNTWLVPLFDLKFVIGLVMMHELQIGGAGSRGAVMRFTVPEKVRTGRPADDSVPRMNTIERPARTTSPWPSSSSPS